MLAWIGLAWGGTEGLYVDRELIALDAGGRAADWHPNRLASDLRLADGQATTNFFDGATRVCPYRATDRQVVITCPEEVHTLQIEGDTLILDLPWGEEVLARSSRTPAEIFRDDARRRTRALLPRVAGTWRRGDERRDWSADAEDVRLAPCFHDEAETICLHLGEASFVLVDGQLAPARVMTGDDGGEWEYVLGEAAGSAWVPDRPCTRGICALGRTDDDGETRWVPVSDRVVDEIAETSSLVGGRLRVERGPGVDRVEVRYRAVTRGAVFLDGVAIGWDSLEAATDWTLLSSDALPSTVAAAPLDPRPDERLAATLRALSGGRADDLVRSRAAVTVLSCASADARPCVTGVGAVEIEVRAYGGAREVDRVTLVLERGF